MKYLNAIIILFMLLSIEGFCQDIEIPETIITGKDRTIYKTPLLFYQYDVKVTFPEIKKVQPPKPTIKPSSKQEAVEIEKKTPSAEFSFVAGKFEQVYSDLYINDTQTMVRLKLLNDNSYRSNDSKKIIDFSLKKQVNNQNFFDINYRGSEKEMPGSIYQPLNKEKHTTILSSNISFSEHDFTTTIIGAYNCLEDLEEKKGLFAFQKHYEKFNITAEIGYDDFAEEGNKILGLSGIYKNKNYQLGIAAKTIGNQTRILPSANIDIEKNNLKFSSGIFSNFSFPSFWEKAGESSYLDMKNVFLEPEENYSVYSILSFNVADLQIRIEGQVSYEKPSYQWRDIDNDNLYEPDMIEDNVITTYGIGITKKIKHGYIEGGFNHQIWKERISGFPKETGYIKLGYNGEKFKPEILIEYTGKQNFNTTRIDGYTIVSALLSYSINQDTTIFCKLNNIFENEYYQAPGYPGRPFELLAGFGIRW